MDGPAVTRQSWSERSGLDEPAEVLPLAVAHAGVIHVVVASGRWRWSRVPGRPPGSAPPPVPPG
jgi:hypothetical protein